MRRGVRQQVAMLIQLCNLDVVLCCKICITYMVIVCSRNLQMEVEDPMPRPNKGTNLTRITVSVDPGDYERMEALADKSGLSTAFLIRRAMHEFLERYGHNGSVSVELKGEG